MKTVKLSTFIENPDNPYKATEADLARLKGKLERVPKGLRCMRLGYVTDHVALDGTSYKGRRVVISGNKRLRELKIIYGDAASVPAEWFCDCTDMTPEERREFIVSANTVDGIPDAEKLLEQYDRDELAKLMGEDAIEELLKSAGQDAGEYDSYKANGEYQKFVDKFKPKLTTDDCYTPEIVYNAVRDWCVKEYNLDGREIVRPFWPGGDYQTFDYPPRCVVIDNPPFSIMSEILKFYSAKGIDYFLFAPALTLFSSAANVPRIGYVVTSNEVTYANGANVRTSFITSLSPYIVDVRPDLWKAVDDANTENQRAQKGEQRKMQFPMAVATAARLGYLANHGIKFRVSPRQAAFIRKLDAQEKGDAIFGGAFLLCERAAAERAAAERAAAERAAAERAAAEKFELSPREIELQKSLGAANAPRQQNNSAHTSSDRLRGSLRSGDTPASLRLCVKNKTTTK